MDIYTDYANWKFENHDYIFQLVKSQSKTISRFTSVIAVVDYLYEKHVKNTFLNEDEQVIFSTGFDYIYDNFYTIKTILDYQFSGDYKELEKCAKTINLLLYVQDFQNELLNQGLDHAIQPLYDFEEKINQYLDKKENVPDAFFPLLNDIANPIFEGNQIEYTPIESIFYEIAIELGIYKNNEYDIYNQVFQLTKKD